MLIKDIFTIKENLVIPNIYNPNNWMIKEDGCEKIPITAHIYINLLFEFDSAAIDIIDAIKNPSVFPAHIKGITTIGVKKLIDKKDLKTESSTFLFKIFIA